MSNIKLIKGNIAMVDCECIVNSARPNLTEGAGVCGAIYSAAGRIKFAIACRRLKGCEVGEAKITPGFKLKAKWIIHTVAPVSTGNEIEEVELSKCYINTLRLAKENGIKEVCFPLIGAGVRHFTEDVAITIAVNAITSWISANADYDMKVLICLDEKVYEKFSVKS